MNVISSGLEDAIQSLTLDDDDDDDDGKETGDNKSATNSFLSDLSSLPSDRTSGTKSNNPSPNSFESYEDLKNYTISQILKIGLCPSLKQEHPEAYIYFRELLQRHPHGKRKKVAMIVDITFKRFAKASHKRRTLSAVDYQIRVQTSDGDEDSISWVKSMRSEDYSVEKKLTSAMRHAIEIQIKKFRSSNRNKACVDCGVMTTLTVDHINHFEGLCYDFLKLHSHHPVEFAKAPITAQDIFSKKDAAYSKLWEDYHQKEANLQILCLACNQGRPEWQCPVERKEKRWKPKEGTWK
jgi:5-methylcytosine-specific restriction endonuclease McrA